MQGLLVRIPYNYYDFIRLLLVSFLCSGLLLYHKSQQKLVVEVERCQLWGESGNSSGTMEWHGHTR